MKDILNTCSSIHTCLLISVYVYQYSLYFQNCSHEDLSWSVVPDVINVSKCCAKEYSGNACSSFLSNWQTCALGQSTSVFVYNTSLLSEDQVIKIITSISKFINKNVILLDLVYLISSTH